MFNNEWTENSRLSTDLFTEFVTNHNLTDDVYYWTARHYFWFSLLRRRVSLWRNAVLKRIFSTRSRFSLATTHLQTFFSYCTNTGMNLNFLFFEIGHDDKSRRTLRIDALGVFKDDFSYSTCLPKLLFEFPFKPVHEFIVSTLCYCRTPPENDLKISVDYQPRSTEKNLHSRWWKMHTKPQ